MEVAESEAGPLRLLRNPLHQHLWSRDEFVFLFFFAQISNASGQTIFAQICRKSTPPFQNFHLLLAYNLELNCIKSDFFHLYLYIVTNNIQVKNKFHKFQKINQKYKTRISWLDKCPPPWVNTWWKNLWQQLQLWVCWDGSPPTLHTLIEKYFPILMNESV